MKETTKIGDWCWSSCGEVYGDTFETCEEALDDARSEVAELPARIYVAQVNEVVSVIDAVMARLDGDRIAEEAEEWIADNYHTEDDVIRAEAPEHWKQLEVDLRTAVKRWATDCDVMAHWYQVGKAEELDLS